MRFLTITVHSGGHGAYERQRRIARALMAAGHEVLWMAPGLDLPTGETHLKVAPKHPLLPGFVGWLMCLRAAFDKNREQLDRVDAIFTVREYDALACLFDRDLKKHPHSFFMRGDTIECERFLMRNSLHLRARVRSAITVLIYPLIQGFIFRRLSRIIVVAQFMADAVERRVRKAAPISVLANDSEARGRLEQRDARHEDAIRELKSGDSFVIGVIGQIFWRAKGFDLFLSAMRRLKNRPDIRAAVLGYGAEEHAVSDHIQAYGLVSQVVFLGRSAAAYRLMPLFDLVVVPTRFTDANPNVVLEALEAGCCILASDIDAHRAQLHYPELLFRNGDDAELARRITELRDDPAVRARNRQLGQERRNIFHFDWDGAVVNVLEETAGGGDVIPASERRAAKMGV